MTPQCFIVNECLALLKQADMPPIKKLRIEIQLIQMKRLLLRNDFPAESCEDILREMLSELRRVGKGEHDADTVSTLIRYMGRFVNMPKCQR